MVAKRKTAKKPAKLIRHKKLDELFSQIEKDRKEVEEIREITFEQLKRQNKKKR